MAHGPLTPIIGLRLLALAAGLRHNAEIGQPGLCFSAYGHKFGINHLASLRRGKAGSTRRARADRLARRSRNRTDRLNRLDDVAEANESRLVTAVPPRQARVHGPGLGVSAVSRRGRELQATQRALPKDREP